MKYPLALVCVLAISGCAFDVSYVKKVPASFALVIGSEPDFVLGQEVKVGLGTGFPTRLKAGTRWHQVGQTESGSVFATKDQIVTVEASNIYEAQLVVSNRCIAGFYLPVEKQLAPVSHPIPIDFDNTNHNQP